MTTTNSSFKDQLQTLRDQIRIKKRSELKDPTPSPMELGKDGEDHINIWEHSDTELGKFLTHNSPFPFNHKYFGKFNSMESFWHYIQSEEKDDRLRVMQGPTLRQFSKKLTTIKISNFKAIVMDSNWQRIKQHKIISEAMCNSTLPFDCYYVNRLSGLRVRPTFYKWLIMGFDEIRAALKENREPDFDFLLDYPKSNIYEFVIPKTPEVE